MDERYITGVVNDCEQMVIYEDLMYRSVVGYAHEGDVVVIDLEDSTDRYYYVYTETSICGYCNKRYIEVA